jgi:VIT family
MSSRRCCRRMRRRRCGRSSQSFPSPRPAPASPKDDALRVAGICLLVFASTLPVVIPFLFIGEVRPALRLSNAIAIVMMFFCGYVFARCTGLGPWPTRLVMVAIGGAMVGVAIALAVELGWPHAWNSMVSGASNRK